MASGRPSLPARDDHPGAVAVAADRPVVHHLGRGGWLLEAAGDRGPGTEIDVVGAARQVVVVELDPVVELWRRYRRAQERLGQARELLSAGDELAALAADEVASCESELASLDGELRLALVPKDPDDERNVVLEVRAGTGGNEASLFAAELFRMYTRYAEKRGWRVEILDLSESEAGGVKEVSAIVEGRGAWSRLKFEAGTHRVQRVPVTESSGRIHTSAATVAVLPEPDEIEVKIDAKDLRIDTMRAGGPGGQLVNTTDSAVRIVHIPTGLIVQCQDEKSQIKNREKALRVLKTRLFEIEQAARLAEETAARRAQVGSGDRSERIRTYNFPQNRVTDHRIGLTLHRLDSVIEGDLDELVDALTADLQAKLLAESA